MKRNVALTLCLLGLFGHSDGHDTASKELIELLVSVPNYAAEFEQSTRDERGKSRHTQLGRVVFSRSHGFRWQIDEPFSQVMVAKHNALYVHDLDLEQLTVTNVRDLPDSAFSLLLMNASEESLARFTVERSPAADESVAVGYLLEPKDNKSVFQKLRIYFVEGVMTRIEVVDHFGHQTDVLFRNPETNQVVELSEFEIVVPRGTDVIGDVTNRDPSG